MACTVKIYKVALLDWAWMTHDPDGYRLDAGFARSSASAKRQALRAIRRRQRRLDWKANAEEFKV